MTEVKYEVECEICLGKYQVVYHYERYFSPKPKPRYCIECGEDSNTFQCKEVKDESKV